MIDLAAPNKFSTAIYSVCSLGDSRYLIPTYQRPYVWLTEQVLKLLDDFWTAFKNGEDKYFIGTIMTSVQDEKEELIDGQQRFTTLWLIAVAFKNNGIKSEITDFLKVGNELRFDFAIREKLKNYLTLLMQDKKLASQKFPSEEIENDDYLVNIARAVSTIESRLSTLRKQTTLSLEGFGDYIYNNIQFVKNTTPTGTDLNKLFATINNSGIQLEQTDILKANLLKRIKTEKELYSRIWEACENMENYFERNVLKLFPKTERNTITPESFSEFKRNEFRFTPPADSAQILNADDFGMALSVILNDSQNNGSIFKYDADTDYTDREDKENVVYCESIISFGQLLLHTYRAFLSRRGDEDFALPFHVKNLLTIFKRLQQESEDDIKSFFEYLWEVRFAFDKHVVKWVSELEGKDKNLVLTNLNKDQKQNQFKRSTKEKDNLSMLQSVLYFTTNYNTQIWLTPFLKLLTENEESLPCLERIDNELSISELEDKETTYKLMAKDAVIDEKEDYITYLNSSLGTSFKHYWFQKLEYILWKNWNDGDKAQFKTYRITSKNSIEHIFPQNPEYGDKLETNVLNSFGNLALLNVSQNSSYSNQYVSKKSIDFSHKETFDSLKLYYVYSDANARNWGANEIKKHQVKMLQLIETHYNYK